MFPNLYSAVLFVIALFVGIFLMLELGRKIGTRRRLQDPDSSKDGFGALEAGIFGLMGLLIAFTFSGAASRFDKRRDLIVDEANIIGTAYLRLDLLPAAAQPALRNNFRLYVDSRLAVYRAIPDVGAVKAKLAESMVIQSEIWTQAVAATKAVEANANAVTSLVLSSLNEMIDITTTRTVALQTHPPALIVGMLAVMVLAGSLLAGFGMAGSTRRSSLHMLAFGILMAGTIYVIIDFEYPRAGLIRVNYLDQLLIDVRDSMK
jgi:hypothetical protein